MGSNISNKKAAEDTVVYNGKYQKILPDPIGSGAFGTVYLVKNIQSKQKCFKNFILYQINQ